MGGTGFLGKEVVGSIRHRGWIPVIFTRKYILTSSDEFITTDYSKDDLQNKLKEFNSVVILASIRGANGTIEDFHQNEILLQNILDSCSYNNITNVCFISSISVYSDTNIIPWRESTIPSPKTFYGVSKLACENIGNIYSRRYGLMFKSLRVAQVLGEGEVKGMMNTFIDNAFDKKVLYIRGKSIAKREYVYVKDVANAICMAIANKDIKGCFNIGSGISYSNLEIAEIINDVFDNKENIKYEDYLDEGIESSLMDISYAKDKLGFYPKYTLREALQDIKNIKESDRRKGNV